MGVSLSLFLFLFLSISDFLLFFLLGERDLGLDCFFSLWFCFLSAFIPFGFDCEVIEECLFFFFFFPRPVVVM